MIYFMQYASPDNLGIFVLFLSVPKSEEWKILNKPLRIFGEWNF
jgi:hypothetical protein